MGSPTAYLTHMHFQHCNLEKEAVRILVVVEAPAVLSTNLANTEDIDPEQQVS